MASAAAPGRVNLIGEHIDYMGYGVFPMALAQRVRVEARRTPGGRLSIRNADEERFPAREHAAARGVELPAAVDWASYVLCGFRAAVDAAADLDTADLGLTLVVSGDVPPAAGLSSSSALVVASAAAVSAALGLALHEPERRHALAAACQDAERLVGTAGGGMDQAVSCLAQAGAAMHIELSPRLEATPVALPAGARFVVAHSGVSSAKAVSAASQFNCRVVECRVACRLLSPGGGPLRLRDAQEALGLSLPEAAAAARALPETVPAAEQAAADETEARVLAAVPELRPRDRAVHVFEEAQRVLDFRAACEAGDLAAMGRLMDASHESCAALYECSDPALDALVARCRALGAAGARLTGAGWGGCAVALVPPAVVVEEFVEALRAEGYSPVFVSAPCGGVSVDSL